MIEQKPAAAPPCWGRQYDETDRECMHQCEHRLSCKSAFQRSTHPGTVSLPMFPPQPQPFWPGVPQAQPSTPSLPAFPGITQPYQQTVRLGQPSPAPAFPSSLQYPQYQPQVPQLPTPPAFQHPQVPTPVIPSTAAAIVQQVLHTPYFMQYYSPYPGETVFQRLAKHMLLRLGQILFQEFSNFLGLWRWPPSAQPSK